MVASRFEVYLVRLNPTEGREIRKTRPCLVISPDEMNRHIGTVIVAPMTTKGRPYPTRVRFGVRPDYGLIGPATFSYSPHHQKSDAAGKPFRAKLWNQRCDGIEEPSRS